MTFNKTATQIIRESIRTAYSVDDKAVEPFSNIGDTNISQELYTSFREKGCTLEFARFTDFDSWEKQQQRFLNSKDLLILDWELKEGGGVPYEDSLAILAQAVSDTSIPFICIYTQTPDSEKVIYNIISYLWEHAFPIEEVGSARDHFFSLLEKESTDFDEDLLEEIIVKSREIFTNPDRKVELNKQLELEFFKKFKGPGLKKKFKALGKEWFGLETLVEISSVIEFTKEGYHKRGKNEAGFSIIPIEDNKTPHALLINNTILIVIQNNTDKGGITPNLLYDRLTEAVSSRPNNFISLLGLEYRNLLRARSMALGTSLNSLDEKAFFYHQDVISAEPDGESSFDFFVKELWESQVTGCWQGYDSKIISKTAEYKKQKNMDSTIESLKAMPTQGLLCDLVRLNIHNTINSYEPDQSSHFRFGNIFKLKKDHYFLCITPHCDCLRPKKIKHLYAFVSGWKIGEEDALNEPDGKYISFFNDEDKIKCVSWGENPRPFTIFIKPEMIDFNNSFQVDYQDEKITLKYVCTQKENYTQRVANQALSYANRVGLSYAAMAREKESHL